VVLLESAEKEKRAHCSTFQSAKQGTRGRDRRRHFKAEERWMIGQPKEARDSLQPKKH